jgi:hypothetical protein
MNRYEFDRTLMFHPPVRPIVKRFQGAIAMTVLLGRLPKSWVVS